MERNMQVEDTYTLLSVEWGKGQIIEGNKWSKGAHILLYIKQRTGWGMKGTIEWEALTFYYT
jgi:hypothetical protein